MHSRKAHVAGRPERARRPRAAPSPKGNPWLSVGSGAQLHIGEFLTFQIIRLANAMKANVTRRYLADFGLSVPEWRLLAMTIRFQPVRFSELVASSSMDKGQASRTLQMLTKRGLIATRSAGKASRRPGDTIATPVIPIGRVPRIWSRFSSRTLCENLPVLNIIVPNLALLNTLGRFWSPYKPITVRSRGGLGSR